MAGTVSDGTVWLGELRQEGSVAEAHNLAGGSVVHEAVWLDRSNLAGIVWQGAVLLGVGMAGACMARRQYGRDELRLGAMWQGDSMARGIGTVISGRRGGDVAGVRYGRGQCGRGAVWLRAA
jgi:hypothetical protein